jgi:NADPH:quinone reductase-like Zn-dependent oxidoreductase
VSYVWAYFWPSDTKLKTISQLLEKEVLKPCVDKVFPLDHFINAFEYFETQKPTGKVVLTFP